MSNALTRAGHGLSLAEKRVVVIAISKIDSVRPVRPGEILRTRITAAEYAEVAQVDMRTAYEALQQASEQLYSRSISFYDPAHARRGKTLEKRQMRWVGEARYHAGEGWVELAWWPELIPHLTGLKHHFTSYQLQQGYALRSVYSWRLLELLMRFKSSGIAEYQIDDFAAAMDASEKQRANFHNFKRRMIEPAVAELSQKGGWKIEWQPVKAGRKVKALRFTFSPPALPVG